MRLPKLTPEDLLAIVLAILLFVMLVMTNTNQTLGDEWEFEVINTQQETKGKDFYYIVRFHAKWCGQCVADENSGKVDKLFKRFNKSKPINIDIDEEPQWTKLKVLPRVERLPTYWLVRSDNTTIVHKCWIGTPTVETVEKQIELIEKPNF